MKAQFDIWEFNFPVKGPHPVILISPGPLREGQARECAVLHQPAAGQRQGRPPNPMEVMLDNADGLSWETFCDCSLMYIVDAGQLTRKVGHVTLERRNAIRDRIRGLFRLPARD